MKKNLIMAFASVALMASCGGDTATTSEEIQAAAEKMCNCMSEKTAERGDKSEDVIKVNDAADYAICGVSVVLGDGKIDDDTVVIDPSSDEFTAAIKETCPKYYEIQVDYAKTFNEE